ncbi:hypothetical protein C0J52_26787 [Blattella germanica]|nr:hypothetical protein C0J52_26787 [Blattella germanica]
MFLHPTALIFKALQNIEELHTIFRILLFKLKNIVLCRIRFIRKYPGVSVPIHRLVCKVRETGAFADKKRNCKRTVLTEEKLDDIGACFEQSPHKSLSKLAQQNFSIPEENSRVWWPKSYLAFSIYTQLITSEVMDIAKIYRPHTEDKPKEEEEEEEEEVEGQEEADDEEVVDDVKVVNDMEVVDEFELVDVVEVVDAFELVDEIEVVVQ